MKRWGVLALLCLGGGVVYLLPYAQYSFYGPLADALHLDHARMGALLSVYGLVNLPGYVLGGLLADRVSSRVLIPLSLFAAGLGGFWLATRPSFAALVAIHVIWSLATVFTYWPAMIKAVRLLGTHAEQGRLFGFRDAGFSLFAFLFAGAGLLIFRAAGEDVTALLRFYSGLYLVAGVASLLWLPPDPPGPAGGASGGLRRVLREPRLWLTGAMIFSAYAISAGTGRLVPYLTTVFGVRPSLAALFGILRTYVISYLAAAAAGILVDARVPIVRFLVAAFVALAASLLALAAIPGRPGLLAAVVIAALATSVLVLSMRGVYWVPLASIDLPRERLGAAVGLVSVIGYLPDAFLFSLYGRVMDRYAAAPALGFRLIFASMIGFAVLGLVFAGLFARAQRAAGPSATSR